MSYSLFLSSSVIFNCLGWKLLSQFFVNGAPAFKREWALMRLKPSCENWSSSYMHFSLQVTVRGFFDVAQ